jgi:ribulose-phosphate 3-epimerase
MNALNIQVMPSILAADMANLAADCRRTLEVGVDGLHVDIMDGHFVPNLSMGPAVVKDLRQALGPDVHLHVHLMIMRPDVYADPFIDAGANTLLIHIESPCDIPATLAHIRHRGVRAGITVNPDTPAEAIASVVGEGQVDEMLVMTVHPGFGGQSFIAGMLTKIQALRVMAPTLPISVDGGIDLQTAPRCAAAGANVLLAGTSLFKAADLPAAISQMRMECAIAFDKRANA